MVDIPPGAGIDVELTAKLAIDAIRSVDPLESVESAVAFTTQQFAERSTSSINMLFDDLEQQMVEWVQTGRVTNLQDAVALIDQQINDSTGPFRQFFDGIDSNANQFGGQAKLYQKVAAEADVAGIDWDAAVGDGTPYIWITAGGNVCQDCIVRHGMKATLSEFTAMGLPKSGFSVCDTRCQCELEPLYKLRQAGININDVRRPVLSYQKQLAKDGTKTGLKIKDIGSIIAGKGEGKVQAAFEKVQRRNQRIPDPDNIAQRRLIRELGKFELSPELKALRNK